MFWGWKGLWTDGETKSKQWKTVNREWRHVWAESESFRNVSVLCHIPALTSLSPFHRAKFMMTKCSLER